MPAPTRDNVRAYLGTGSSAYTDEQIDGALAAELVAQAGAVTYPTDGAGAVVWPAPLEEALCRRVARNLALRALPLGVQASISEAAAVATRVGGTDLEIRRLEGPYSREGLLG